VLVHPGQIRVSNVLITGRKPYYVAESVNETFQIQTGQTQFILQSIEESLLVTLDDYGKIFINDDLVINRYPPACLNDWSRGYVSYSSLPLAEPPFAQRDMGLCPSVCVDTTPARSASGSHVWVPAGETVTVRSPDKVACDRDRLSGFVFQSTVVDNPPCKVEWHGAKVAGHHHGLTCTADEFAICETTGTGERVSAVECHKADHSTTVDGEPIVAFRITIGGKEPVGVLSGASFVVEADTVVTHLPDDE